MNIENVYPSDANLLEFNREFTINDYKKLANIKDNIIFTKKDNKIYQNFVSRIKPLASNKIVKWIGDNGILTVANICSIDDVEISKEKIINHLGIEETIYRTLIREKTSSKEYISNLMFYIET